MWEIIWTAEARKNIKKIDKKNQKRIVMLLDECMDDPITRTSQLTNSPYRRLKVGDYRVIMNLIKNKMIINIIRVRHGKNSYKF